MSLDKLIIVGGGAFGLSTALEYSKRNPLTEINVIDRHELPCQDGSSVDSSRILRADYASEIYSELMLEALPKWKQDPQLSKWFYPSGMLLCNEGENSYVSDSFENVKKRVNQNQLEVIEGGLVGIRKKILGKDKVEIANNGVDPLNWKGYLNKTSGWANAEESIRVLVKRAEQNPKIKLLKGEMSKFLYRDDSPNSAVIGVQLKDGRRILANLVVLATGAWSPQLLDLRGKCVATGQALVYMKITPEEERLLSKSPVVLELSTGCFFIPPKGGELKVARHAMGYYHYQQVQHWRNQSEELTISVPKTKLTHPDDDRLPKEAEEAMRAWMKNFLPEFADREFCRTRLCWYSDTPSGDFIISYHPNHQGLFVATGGSGHAFKFLPVLGEKIVDAIEGKLEEKYASKWKWKESNTSHKSDGSRGRGDAMDLSVLLRDHNHLPDVKNREMHSLPKPSSKL